MKEIFGILVGEITCRNKLGERSAVYAHLCRMRPLMGSRASYTVRASLTQWLGSMRNEVTVRRMREPGTAVSFTWQLTPPHDEKTFKGTLAPRRLAYSLSTHSEPGRSGKNLTYTIQIQIHWINAITYLHPTYNLIAEQLHRDTTISLSMAKYVMFKRHETHHWWGSSLYPQGDPAGSLQMICSSCWCGPSLSEWLQHTPHTLLGSSVGAPQTPSRNEPAHHPYCCCWVIKAYLLVEEWHSKSYDFILPYDAPEIHCTWDQKWQLACRVWPPRTSCTRCSPRPAETSLNSKISYFMPLKRSHFIPVFQTFFFLHLELSSVASLVI